MTLTNDDYERLRLTDAGLAARAVVLQARWDFALTLSDPIDRATAMDGIGDGFENDDDWADWRSFRDARLAEAGLAEGAA